MKKVDLIKIYFAVTLSFFATASIAQTDSLQIDTRAVDSLYIEEIEEKEGPIKLLHAEPLYVDLIRDLGARKGEKEWNLGLGLADNLSYDKYLALIEYEWAPVDRLGFEIELPFNIVGPARGVNKDSIPSSRLESFKTALQWTFLVNEPLKTSMALGYINELELSEFRNFGNPILTGNVYNPFFVAAKRWGQNYHTLIYTGPQILQHFGEHHLTVDYHLNSNFHFMLPGTRNFIGVEVNKIWSHGDFDMTVRPQMRLGIADNFLVGVVAGIPVYRENERLSMFTRIIWEPGHRHHHAIRFWRNHHH